MTVTPPASTQKQSRGPLSGVTVIESASIVAGPLAAQFLGDLGADVIKIEPPEGDLTRKIGPRRSEDMGSFFLTNNRNKRSVVLDLKVQEGRDVLNRMVAGADVFLHSIRTSAAARLSHWLQLRQYLYFCTSTCASIRSLVLAIY